MSRASRRTSRTWFAVVAASAGLFAVLNSRHNTPQSNYKVASPTQDPPYIGWPEYSKQEITQEVSRGDAQGILNPDWPDNRRHAYERLKQRDAYKHNKDIRP